MTVNQMVGWHHQLDGCEFEQTLRRIGKPGMLQSWGRKELDTTEQLNNNEPL